jgi:hypothetical protein
MGDHRDRGKWRESEKERGKEGTGERNGERRVIKREREDEIERAGREIEEGKKSEMRRMEV